VCVCVERAHYELTLYGEEYIAYGAPHSAIISNRDELSVAFQTSQQTAFIALIGKALITTTMRLSSDRRSTPIRLQFDRAPDRSTTVVTTAGTAA